MAEHFEGQEPLLQDVRGLFRRVDPVPDGLVEMSLFAVMIEQLHAEAGTVELEHVETPELVARSNEASEREIVRTGTITFACEPVTVMINLSESPTGMLCVDGWVAPAAQYRVELYQPGARVTVDSDEDGGFVLLDVPEGPSCLALRRVDGEGPTVCTPVIEL
jgi:hypothetical protein